MKKLLTLALVGAMLTATGITAFAADPTTDVTYEVAPIYTVVIPESVTLGDTAVTEQIKIYGADENSNVILGLGKKVNVALSASTNNFNVVLQCCEYGRRSNRVYRQRQEHRCRFDNRCRMYLQQ